MVLNDKKFVIFILFGFLLIGFESNNTRSNHISDKLAAENVLKPFYEYLNKGEDNLCLRSISDSELKKIEIL